MNSTETNSQMDIRWMTEISHHLKAPIHEIQNYSRMLLENPDQETMAECAEKIDEAAKRILNMMDNNLLELTASAGHMEEEEDSLTELPHVLVVDDDALVRNLASNILGKRYRVTAVSSGRDAFSVLRDNKVSLVLMDVMMPDMDGFETLRRIRSKTEWSTIPVIFLTGDENRETEIRCFRSGASDFVRKPFLAQVLVERVRRIIDLDHLQNFLSREVVFQTKRAGHLSQEVMMALSKAVDAKDHYTNGHSQRVAKYSREIARRMGKSMEEVEDIYAMGLLHDVGKIGVSEAIINKKTRLTDDEYAQIKDHTIMGYEILKVITEIPGLATGARWHHERYDGRGYPDRLSGTNIPEEARIICVADCYDAMTSNRSYSKVRPQWEVRAEILRCRGTQFDPEIADIMIAMIDDDVDYRMSERPENEMQPEKNEEDFLAETAKAVPAKTDAGNDARQVADTELAEAKTAAMKKVLEAEIDGRDMKIARENIPDNEILYQSMDDYYKLMPQKQKTLEDAFSQIETPEELDNYRINVHSMKSSSAMLGFHSLSEKARQLEELSRKKDIPAIRTLHGQFMEEWNKTYGQLRELFPKPDLLRKNQGKGEAGIAGNVQGNTGSEPKKKTVMIIDDDAMMLRTLKNILEKEYSVVLATSGLKAIPLIQKKHPDIILLDYEMPVCNGAQTLEMIRIEKDIKNIPVIFLTGTSAEEVLDKIQALNPAGYLMKPLNMGKLKQTLEAFV